MSACALIYYHESISSKIDSIMYCTCGLINRCGTYRSIIFNTSSVLRNFIYLIKALRSSSSWARPPIAFIAIIYSGATVKTAR